MGMLCSSRTPSPPAHILLDLSIPVIKLGDLKPRGKSLVLTNLSVVKELEARSAIVITMAG
jgi:hypothetical protein